MLPAVDPQSFHILSMKHSKSDFLQEFPLELLRDTMTDSSYRCSQKYLNIDGIVSRTDCVIEHRCHCTSHLSALPSIYIFRTIISLPTTYGCECCILFHEEASKRAFVCAQISK